MWELIFGGKHGMSLWYMIKVESSTDYQVAIQVVSYASEVSNDKINLSIKS